MDAEALRQMLKRSRDAISPEAAGLPPRRDPRGGKAPGLSQTAMDHLLGRASGTYSRLERGVLDNPSPEYLRDVAQLLGFTEQEWVTLYGYARGERPPFPLLLGGAVSVPGHWIQTVQELSQPAYTCDYAGNVLAYNEAAADMFPGRRVPKNTLYFMLFDPARKEILIDWETAWAPTVVPMLRALRAQYRKNPTLQRLEVMCLADPVLADLYMKRQTIPVGLTHPDGDYKPYHHHEHGPGWMKVSVSTPLMAPTANLFLLSYHPGDRPGPCQDVTVDTSADFTGYFPAAS